MAAPMASSSRLTGLCALLAAVGLALFEPGGPWQPLSVLLGWAVVLAVVVSLLTARATGLAVGASLTCVRLGIHGVAGNRTPGLVASAFLLILAVEMGADSIESRRVPIGAAGALLRSTMIAAAGGGLAGLLSLVTGVEVGGSVRFFVGLAAAVLVAVIVLGLVESGARAASRPDQEPSE